MFYNKNADEIFKIFKSSANGLKEIHVKENRQNFGENKLYEKKKRSLLSIFIGQFKDLLVIILIIAALISMATGNSESTLVIIAVLILNAALGTVQYVKSEKSLESLKQLSSPSAKVIRDGKNFEIKASELVCGDVVSLEAGDIVPGDGRLIECHSLKVNESSLTGESAGVEKSTDVISGSEVPLGDQKNMVFSGSLVTYGRGKALIVSVGKETELGKIADLMNSTVERKTPLQESMDNFSKKLSIAIVLICIVVFGLNIFRGMSLTDSLLFAVALAVAAIPEALSSIITISLAIGTSRMAKENAIIKQLNAVEGLGCVSVICSDKTGTLTQNKMTVESVFCPEKRFSDELLNAFALCNDTTIIEDEPYGDPTETALVYHYAEVRNDYNELKQQYPRLSELPFDSDRKLMSTLHLINGTYTIYIKGAVDVILERTAGLSESQKEVIRKQNREYSKSGLRVLAFARRQINEKRSLVFEDENELEFLGLAAEADPPRKESAKAVSDCIAAGIKPIMITGDHKITASAIATKIGIMKSGDLAVTGADVDKMTNQELYEKLPEISVYARVSPGNKIRIVKAWQDLGHIVAMTGDGVNDAPALKSADVGVAMGITGTEVAKDSASVILTDDNFATIIKSVLNGRNIYANIKNAILFLLSGNAAGIIAVLYTSIMALPAPFTAVQLLFINLITDSLPALAISMEPSNPTLLSEQPRKRSESVLTRTAVRKIAFQGLLISIATIIAFHIGLKTNAITASTMAFATLCTARLWHGFNSRGNRSIFSLGITTNMYTVGAFVLGIILLSLILFVPFMAKAFASAPLTPTQAGWIALLSFCPTVIIQIAKIIKHRTCV